MFIFYLVWQFFIICHLKLRFTISVGNQRFALEDVIGEGETREKHDFRLVHLNPNYRHVVSWSSWNVYVLCIEFDNGHC